MGEPLESEYFIWLCAKVVDRADNNYYALLDILHKTEFVWIVPGDRHRAEDGIELREIFQRETRNQGDPDWEALPCSVFEALLSFANRASFQTSTPARDWFWEFMANLNLDQYRRVLASDIPEIEDILYTFIWRQYDFRGNGGLFPLSQTLNDQRKVEIWYQFSEYVIERGLF